MSMGGLRNSEKGSKANTGMTQVACNVCRQPYIVAPLERRRVCPPCRTRYMVPVEEETLSDEMVANLVTTFLEPDIPIVDESVPDPRGDDRNEN